MRFVFNSKNIDYCSSATEKVMSKMLSEDTDYLSAYDLTIYSLGNIQYDTCSKTTLCGFKDKLYSILSSVHLQPLDGLFAARAEHDAVMETGDGSSTAGQG